MACVNHHYIESPFWDSRSRSPLFAQPVFTDVFPPDEYAARRAKVMAKIGDAVAIIQGTTERPDEMRGTKSPREIAILREATRIAGLGIIEAMRDARPGMKEYELQADAEYVFKKYGAYGPAYFALIATGQNTWYSHYHKNTRALDAGDLVQVDYAPDFKYYASDVTRVFPAGGRFNAQPLQFPRSQCRDGGSRHSQPHRHAGTRPGVHH